MIRTRRNRDMLPVTWVQTWQVSGVILIVQLALVSWTFPASEVFTETPLLYGDAGYHWYQIKVARNLAESWALFGYDPFFNAGYVGGLTWNGSARLAALIAVLLGPRITEAVAYKIFAFGAALAAPAGVPLAAKWFGATRTVTWIAGILSLPLWWVSMFRWYHTAGMNSFVLASFVALPYVAAVWVNLQSAIRLWPLLGLGAFGGFVTFVHPFFPIAVALPVGALLIAQFRTIEWARAISAAVIVGALAVACNLFWIVPSLRLADWLSPGEVKHVYQRIVDPMLIVCELAGRWQGNAHGAKIYTLLALLSAWGCLRPRGATEATLARSLTLAAALVAIYAFVGAAVPPFVILEPNRFAPVAYLFLLVPASLGGVGLARTIVMNGKSYVRYVAFGLSIPVALLSGFVMYEFAREVSYFDVGRYGTHPPEITGEGPYTRTLLRWLEDYTTPDGRVLFECSLGRIYDGARVSGYLAYKSKREFIGGPYPFRHFASFWDNWLFGRPTSEHSPDELSEYLQRYNIGWAIVHSPSAKTLLEQVPGAKKLDEFKEFTLYGLNGPPGYFELGSGRVRARDHNRVEFENVHGDRVILRYHYFPSLRVEPSADIRPIRLGDDPTPFIELITPASRFTLRLR